MQKVLYVVLFLLAAVAAGFAHHSLLAVLNLSRKATFFFSFSLAITLGALAYLEEKRLWRGYFGFTSQAYRSLAVYRRLAPAPLSTGAMCGVISFLVWS